MGAIFIDFAVKSAKNKNIELCRMHIVVYLREMCLTVNLATPCNIKEVQTYVNTNYEKTSTRQIL